MTTPTRVLAAALAAIAIAAVPAASTAREAAPPAWVTKATTQLAHLTVRPAAPMTGYSRDYGHFVLSTETMRFPNPRDLFLDALS